MTAQEREIYYYLKARRHEFIPLREICRRTARKRRYRASPDWARSILHSMTDRGILEGNPEQGYRLKPIPKKATHGKRWVAPEIAKLLKLSGRSFDNVITVDDEDTYYDAL